MEERKIEFTFRNVRCIVFYDEYKKEFCVSVYKEADSIHATRLIGLFHVDRFSKSQLKTAVHVANRHVLPKVI